MSNPSKRRGTAWESAVVDYLRERFPVARVAAFGPAPKSVADRVDGKLLITKSGCLEWQGALRNGYAVLVIGSRADNSRVVVRLHRIVWEAFHRRTVPTGLVIRHSCDNRRCVHPEHLLVGTHRANTADMDTRGRRGDGRNFGEANGRSRLTAADVKAIRERYPNDCMTNLALEYGVGRTTIRQVVTRDTWKAVG